MLGRKRTTLMRLSEGGLKSVVCRVTETTFSAGVLLIPAGVAASLEGEAVWKVNAVELIGSALSDLGRMLPKVYLGQAAQAEMETRIAVEVMRYMQIKLLDEVARSIEVKRLVSIPEEREETESPQEKREEREGQLSEQATTQGEPTTAIFKERIGELVRTLTFSISPADIAKSRLISTRFKGAAEQLSSGIQSILSGQQGMEQVGGALQLVFSSLLLNLRRLIREWLGRVTEALEWLLEHLKQLELRLYYLSAAVLPAPARLARAMAADNRHPLRGRTYLHLLHDPLGFERLQRYLSEAPFCELQADMNLVSLLLNAPDRFSRI